MCGGAEKGQLGLVYDYKTMMGVGFYFKYKIQSNILLLPNR